MRRLAAATTNAATATAAAATVTVAVAVTTLLAGAALVAGTAAAQAATTVSTSPISVPMIPAPMIPAPMAPSQMIPAPMTPAPAPGTLNPGGFAIHLLGGLHLKRVDTTTGQTHTGYLLCTSTTSGSAAPVIHGVGGVKDPTSACAELAEVNGDFDALAVHPTWMAPSFVAPVAVQAAGTWEGAKVAWSHQYSNSGVLVRTTGDVFAF
ncbi:hypothetical protein KGQ20_36280 [Catenulispora sp. NF23]|uniref:SSI family serine proteinase inhibitor n=1 Tax=Catenulispora pinistramenti TaxID=2705254 RepID=UPI001BA718BD|nr:SSI family serine proteinase inhibitor [Catenulispora pinistramenti]MBS2538224.1 hypothetical protein [Catenulispora pinistramenti]